MRKTRPVLLLLMSGIVIIFIGVSTNIYSLKTCKKIITKCQNRSCLLKQVNMAPKQTMIPAIQAVRRWTSSSNDIKASKLPKKHKRVNVFKMQIVFKFNTE